MNKANAGSFTDHPRKIKFRSEWAEPILRHLCERLNKKLVYLGLPGIKALDILAWKSHLRKVIAFQADDYDGRSGDITAEEELLELQRVLNELEEKKFIETYALYIGYIEQVVMSGEDNLGNPFVLNDYVTVYNLDFCNRMSTPYEVVGPDFNTFKCYKIDVIDKLLQIEKERFLKGVDACFVMFLTVNAHFIERMVSSINNKIIKDYISKNLRGANGERRMVRLLKAYAFHALSEVFEKHDFHFEILPTIYYQGSGNYYDDVRKKDVPYWLSTFTVFGTPKRLNQPSISFEQDFGDFLIKKFVFINDRDISCYTEAKSSIHEIDFDVRIQTILSESKTLTELWSS